MMKLQVDVANYSCSLLQPGANDDDDDDDDEGSVIMSAATGPLNSPTHCQWIMRTSRLEK